MFGRFCTVQLRSDQLRTATGDVARVICWLAWNHGKPDVVVHPDTDGALRHHRRSALWIGASHGLILSVFVGDAC